jgi:hypothetical protein
LLKQVPETKLVGLSSANSHESLTFAQMLGGPHFHVEVGPMQYDEIDIGDPSPIRCLKNGLWMGRGKGLPTANSRQNSNTGESSSYNEPDGRPTMQAVHRRIDALPR